ncbi:Queuine/other tRNA-ribosyltransferase [Methanocaldococcus sp. FS406-22]|nr:Queuine/other tRNA-ribosyltransferase [Methanocaldococcus sp. FS406-22]
MKFFLPDWEDRVDPWYDFKNDKYSSSHKKSPYENDIYAHQLFDVPPYDGILVSLGVFKSKITLKDDKNPEIRGKNNIKDFLKIDNGKIEVMGDCGAFTYVHEKNPPPFYSVERVANLYERLGFDYGVSVDHLVLDYVTKRVNGEKKRIEISKREKNRRIKLTLKNAEKFLKLHKQNKFNFEPIGVAQGYDIETYTKSVKKLVDLGYEYIALGSLVRYKTEEIVGILESIEPYTENVKIHLFGVLRPEAIKIFRKLGVTSFDSASYLRKAWLRSGRNYLAYNGMWYSAIRVPYSDDPRLVNNGKVNGYSIPELKKMESKALKLLFKYDQGEATITEVLNAVLKYDQLLLRDSENMDKFEEKYIKTLEDKPWKQCNCNVCKSIGINVIIFRGTNRNKRRGFHNIWVFKNVLMNKL